MYGINNLDFYLQITYLICTAIASIILIIKIPWDDGLELLCCIVSGLFWPLIVFVGIISYLIDLRIKMRSTDVASKGNMKS